LYFRCFQTPGGWHSYAPCAGSDGGFFGTLAAGYAPDGTQARTSGTAANRRLIKSHSMQSEARTRLHLGAATDWLPRWLAVLFPFSIAGSVLGQSAMTPPPGFQGAPAVPIIGVPAGSSSGRLNGQANGEVNGQANGANGEGDTSGSGTAAVAKPVENLMQWGALHLRTIVSYQFLYDAGVNVAPGQSADTFTHTISATLLAQLGPHVSLTYTPSYRIFSQSDFHNTLDHSVSLNASTTVGDWGFGLSQSFDRSDEPLVETSSQTATENFATALSASYRFNDKISFDTSGTMGFVVIESGKRELPPFLAPLPPPTSSEQPLSDSQSYSGSEWVNYQFDEKFSGGVGVTLGYNKQSGGFESMDEQYMGRISWHPGEKLTISLSGGIDDQQFLNTGAPDVLKPIFSASAGYHLFEPTTISLSASRAVSASLFQSEITENTQVGIGLQQRLFGKLQLSVGFSYSTADFKSTLGNLATVRSDESTSYNVGLSMPFLTRGSFGTFYQYSKNSSNDTGFGYASNEAGATVSWTY
jgi:hypothetical protein